MKEINLGLKMLYLSLWAGMSKIYCHVFNQYPPICLIAKSRAKIRTPQLTTKNALFGFFRQSLLYLQS